MSDDQIKCIVLKVNDDALLMPNASVAEIVPIKRLAWQLSAIDFI